MQRVVGVVVEVERGENQDAAAGAVDDAPGGLDAVKDGHPHVHEDDVGRPLDGGLDGLLPVAGLAQDADVGVGSEHRPETRPDQGLIVHDQHADQRASRHGVRHGGRHPVR